MLHVLHDTGRAALAVILAFAWDGLPWLPTSTLAAGDTGDKVETVRGSGCYRFGDEETPAKARRAAMAVAQEAAIRTHRVFVESSSRVKNFQLEDDLIQTASAAILQNVLVEKEERKNQEVCITLTATLSPVSVEDLIRQRVQAREISQEAQAVAPPEQAGFGLRLWTNREQGRFLENDRLIIYVRSDRDAYLKLDYFQADGTVVHLVPNLYRGQAFIAAGRTYAFGDEAGPDQFVVKAPFGDETIKAIASVRPFELAHAPTETTSASRRYLDDLKEGLRGIKVVAAAASVGLTTESKAVAEYKGDAAKPPPQAPSTR